MNSGKPRVIAFIVVSFLVGFFRVAVGQKPVEDRVIFKDVAVFDGTSLLSRRSVLIANGKIVDIDFKGDIGGAQVVEGKGRTLLPGLIDSHVHAYQDLELPLLFGMTTEIDMFMGIDQMREVKARMAKGSNHNSVDIVSSGTLVTVEGGHGTEYGLKIPTISGPEQARQFVDDRIAEGSDFIKIIYQASKQGSKSSLKSMDQKTMAAVIAAAHKRGKLAVVHALDLRSAQDAVASGADGLAHIYSDVESGEEFAKLLAKRRVFVIPTYAVLEAFAGRTIEGLATTQGFRGLLTQGNLMALRNNLGKKGGVEKLDTVVKANIGALRAAGVVILAGTDAGNPGTLYGLSLHRELELLVQAGMPPSEALAAATSRPAKVFGLTDRGRIAPGLKADLVLVEGDPTTDILATRNIVEVWKDGRSRSSLRQAQKAKVLTEQQAKKGRQQVVLPPDGRIGEFTNEGGSYNLHSPFGAGWHTSTDQIAGGKSEVRLAVEGKTPDGLSALSVSGAIKAGFPYPWAGVTFYPGERPFVAVDLSNAKGIRFMVRGDGRKYQFLAYCEANGFRPSSSLFEATMEWREVVISFNHLAGFDVSGVTALSFAAGVGADEFHFEIANVRLDRQ